MIPGLMDGSGHIKSKQLQMPFDISALPLRDQLQKRSSLFVAATGLGKTVMMAAMAKHWPVGRVLVLSHRFELNQQAISEFEKWCKEEVDLEQAMYRADMYGQCCRIVVASIQTLNSKIRSRKHKLHGHYRMERFYPEDFGLVMIDEAHRSTAESYRRVMSYFAQNEDCRFIGVTATPDRSDKVGLGNIFSHISCDYNIRWAVEQGWLVEPVQKFVQIDGLDMRSIRTTKGDFDQKELGRLVEIEENLHSMAKPIVDLAGPEDQAIVFTASVRQAHRLAEMIRDYAGRKFGVLDADRAVCIDGSLSPQDPRRRALVKRFKNGEIQYLVNCGVATEGFDAPSVKLIAIGRPTKSRALYTQMVGRGTRPLPGVLDQCKFKEERIKSIANSGKPNCLVLDFVGQAGRHKLVCTTDILSTEGEDPEIQERATSMMRSGFDGTAIEALRAAREEQERIREAQRAKITVDVSYQLRDAGSAYSDSILPEVKCPNYLKNKGVTDKQRSFMIKLGFTHPQIDGMNPRKASAAIDYAIKHPRNSFGRWLKKQKIKEGTLKE